MNSHVRNLAWNFGLFDCIPDRKPTSIASAEADASRRPIGVTAFLEDPRARTPQLWVHAPNQTENHVNVDDNIVDIWVQSKKCDANRFNHLFGKKFSWCFQKMNSARRFLAHPFTGGGSFISFDSPDTIGQLSDLANLAERMAIEIIVEEMRVIRALGSSETTERVMASYLHETWGQDLLRSDR